MTNPIKYSTSNQSLALRTGNFWIGTGDSDKGPTVNTDYWAGITPPSNGYTIYVNKSSNGPSIFTPQNDQQLIGITNQIIGGGTCATAQDCFDYYSTQVDKKVFNRSYESIITNGLIMSYDAGFLPSYKRTGTTCSNMSSSTDGSLVNSLGWTSSNGGSFLFDGSNDHLDCGTIFNSISTGFSIEAWIYPTVADTKVVASNGTSFANNTFYLAQENSTQFGFLVNSPQTVIYTNFTYTINTWYHLVGTSQIGDVIRIYINGTTVESGSTNVTSYLSGNTNLRVGIQGTNFPFGGRIPIVRLYNRALSASEVLSNFNAQKSRFGL